MVEKIKIEIWDIYIYIITGCVVVLNIGLYCYNPIKLIVDGIVKLELPTLILIIFFLSMIIVIGYIIEPIANFYGKIIKKLNLFRNNKNWEKAIENQTERAKEYIFGDIDNNNIYHYCKNYLIVNNIETSYMAFLSKFGFYRNISFLFFINSLIMCYFSITKSYYILVVVIIMLSLSILYAKRSSDFYCHLTQTIYQNFIIDNYSKKKDSSNKLNINNQS